MPKIADRVQETTTTTGTGTVTLAGAKTGYQSFSSAFSNADKVYYCIEDGTNWEVGVGTFTTSGTTLSRDTIFASSNAGAAVNFGAGDKNVFCTAPSQAIGGVPVLSNKTGAYTVVASDNGKVINCTSGTFTVSLTDAATLGAGFSCWVTNSGTGTITLDPNGTETVNGNSTSVLLKQGGGYRLLCDGSKFIAIATVTSGWGSTSGLFSVQIASEALASGANSVAIGKASTASGTRSIAIGSFSTTATNDDAIAIGARASATSTNAVAIGNNSGGVGSQAVTGSGAMALGGSYASGTDSFAAAIANNTSTYGATGANAVAMGQQAKASGNNSVSLGDTTTASGTRSLAIGSDNVASGITSFALGRQSSAAQYGKYAYASGQLAVAGDAQTGVMVLRRSTTDATPTVTTSDNSAAGTANQFILPNNSAYAFDGIIVARRQAAGGTESAAWKVEGLIRREANAGTTTLVASTITAISNAPGWTLALSADTTNGGLAVTFTGTAATNIRTVATLRTSEVTYA